MALTVGELVATFSVDPSEGIRGLNTAELRMRGFQRDAEGHLRRVDGSLVDTATAARELGTSVMRGMSTAQLATAGYTRDATGQLRDVRGRYVAAGDAAERMGHQMLRAGVEGAAAARMLGAETDRHLGERGVSGRSRLATSALAGLRAGFSAVASSAGPALATVGKLPAMLGVGIPLAATLASTLANIVPAASVAATGILAVVTASFALKIGMSGVGDAVKAAFDPGTKPAELKAALAGLAPPARSFVLALRGMKPEFDALKLDVQGRLFADLGATVNRLGTTVLPTVRGALGNAAGALNLMALGAAGAALNLGASGTLGKALDGATTGLRNLSGIPGMIVTALGQLAAAAAPTFGRLTAAAGDAAASISGKLNKAFTSGALSSAIGNAVGIIKQIGTVAGNVGRIISGVFKAAQTSGGGLLGTLSTITGTLATAVSTPAVQQGLTAVFGLFSELSKLLGGSLGPIIGQVASAFGQIAPVITTVLQSLGDATPVVALLLLRFNPLLGILALLAPVLGDLAKPIGQMIQGLSPLIEAVGAFSASLGKALVPIVKGLAPVLAAASGAIGAMLTALSPLLPIIGDLIGALLPVFVPVLKAVGTIFGQLAGPVKEIATALGTALQPIIKSLGDIIGDLVTQYLAVFMDVLGNLIPLVPVLTPVLIQLGESIGQILEAVAPLLPQMLALSTMFLTQLLPAILPLVPPLMQLVSWLLTLATDVIVKVVVPAMQGLIDFMGGLQKKLQPAIDAVKWLTTGIASLFEWLSDHLVGHSVIPDMVRSIVGWFAGLPGKAIAALGNIASRLGGVISDAARRMVSAMSTGVTNAVNAVAWLPYKAWKALGDLGGYLKSSGQALIQGFIDGIWSKLSAVGTAVSGVLSFAKDHFPNSPAKRGPFSGSGWTFHSGVATARDWAAGVASQQDHVSRAAAALMGSASGSLGGLGAGFGGGLAGAAGGAAAGAAGAAGGVQTIRIEVAGPEEVKRLIRTIVKRDGRGGSSSVQTVFG